MAIAILETIIIEHSFKCEIERLAKRYCDKAENEFKQRLHAEYLRLCKNPNLTETKLECALKKFLNNNELNYFPKIPSEKNNAKRHLKSHIGIISSYYLEGLTKSGLKEYINSNINKNYSSTKKQLMIDIIDYTDFNNKIQHKQACHLIHNIAVSAMNNQSIQKIISLNNNPNYTIEHYALCFSLHKRFTHYKKVKKPKITIPTTLNDFCHNYIMITGDKITALDIINYFKNLFGFKKANSTLTGDYKRIPKAPNKETLINPFYLTTTY